MTSRNKIVSGKKKASETAGAAVVFAAKLPVNRLPAFRLPAGYKSNCDTPAIPLAALWIPEFDTYEFINEITAKQVAQVWAVVFKSTAINPQLNKTLSLVDYNLRFSENCANLHTASASDLQYLAMRLKDTSEDASYVQDLNKMGYKWSIMNRLMGLMPTWCPIMVNYVQADFSHPTKCFICFRAACPCYLHANLPPDIRYYCHSCDSKISILATTPSQLYKKKRVNVPPPF